MELDSDDDGRVSGQLSAEGAEPVPFDGWVQLMRVLEDGAQLATDGDTQTPPSGRDGQETAWDR